jgi:hypothetical protein
MPRPAQRKLRTRPASVKGCDKGIDVLSAQVKGPGRFADGIGVSVSLVRNPSGTQITQIAEIDAGSGNRGRRGIGGKGKGPLMNADGGELRRRNGRLASLSLLISVHQRSLAVPPSSPLSVRAALGHLSAISASSAVLSVCFMHCWFVRCGMGDLRSVGAARSGDRPQRCLQPGDGVIKLHPPFELRTGSGASCCGRKN